MQSMTMLMRPTTTIIGSLFLIHKQREEKNVLNSLEYNVPCNHCLPNAKINRSRPDAPIRSMVISHSIFENSEMDLISLPSHVLRNIIIQMKHQ